jgi:hypothetical protein
VFGPPLNDTSQCPDFTGGFDDGCHFSCSQLRKRASTDDMLTHAEARAPAWQAAARAHWDAADDARMLAECEAVSAYALVDGVDDDKRAVLAQQYAVASFSDAACSLAKVRACVLARVCSRVRVCGVARQHDIGHDTL